MIRIRDSPRLSNLIVISTALSKVAKHGLFRGFICYVLIIYPRPPTWTWTIGGWKAKSVLRVPADILAPEGSIRLLLSGSWMSVVFSLGTLNQQE